VREVVYATSYSTITSAGHDTIDSGQSVILRRHSGPPTPLLFSPAPHTEGEQADKLTTFTAVLSPVPSL
jgi:hypothetical protein